ncbi:hypothetical protein [Caudoviricetes sp.]|nr:hypothetical protein [Caudoviricetes sp.]
MTSSQCDQRSGQDDAIGGDARENSELSPTPGAWYFEETYFPVRMLYAIEPDGTRHAVRMGDMNSLDGTKLLNAMARDLTKR